MRKPNLRADVEVHSVLFSVPATVAGFQMIKSFCIFNYLPIQRAIFILSSGRHIP